jgi:hypothetical protein
MLGGIQDVYLGDVRGAYWRGGSSPIRLGGAGVDAVSVWRSVCRVDGFLGDGGTAACSSGMVLFSVQAANSAVTESRLMGAAGATVDGADGVVREQGVGSADVGQMRPDVRIGVGRGGVCREWAAGIAPGAWTAGCSPYTRTPAPPYAKGFLNAAPATTPTNAPAPRDLYIGYYSCFVKARRSHRLCLL